MAEVALNWQAWSEMVLLACVLVEAVCLSVIQDDYFCKSV